MDSIRKIVRNLREGRIITERVDYEKYSRDELIKLAQGGDRLAIEYLINSHKDFINMMSRKYIMDGNDGDDIEQLATIAFWDAINSYNPKKNGDFEAYAGMIIKRKLTDELRKDSAEKRQINHTASSLSEPIAGDEESGTLGDKIAASKYSAEEAFLGKEGAREIIRFMEENLSDAERTVIKKYIAGYKVSEISEETGMGYKKVENAIMRVKNKLAEYMRKSYGESRRMRESDLEFSDEEKQILTSVLSKVDERKEINALKESYENYTEEQIDKELSIIGSRVEDISEKMRRTESEDGREDLLQELDDLYIKLLAMEEYMNSDQYDKYMSIISKIYDAQEMEYEYPEPDYDAKADDIDYRRVMN